MDALPVGMRPIVDQLRVEFTAAQIVTGDSTDGGRTVATIAAPVLDESGHTSLIIAGHPLRPMTTREIESTAGALLAEVRLVRSEVR